MKKYTKFAYLAIILIVLALGFFTYKVFSKNGEDEDIKSKSLAEVKYLEDKFLNLFNQMNNISFENYNISASKVKKQETENKSSDSSQNSQGNGGSTGGANKNEQNTSNESKDSEDSEDNKKFNLEETGILTKNTDINWKQVKNDVENIYASLYPMTLDLYKTEINQNDIVNFNKEYDNLTKAIRDENKDEVLIELSKLYDYLPKFIDNIAKGEKDKIILRTKNEIFKAYSILDQEEWTAISGNINNAIQEFTKLVTNISNQEKVNQYNINKSYVIINELQNAVLLRDKDIFLIKYKNLVEELQNI